MNTSTVSSKEKTTLRTVMLIATLFLGYIMIYVDKLSISISIIPISKELGITPSQKGMIMSAFFLGYAVMQIPYGFLNSRLGSKKILTFSIFSLGIFAALFSFGTSIIYFILIRFLAGAIAHAGYPQSASKEVQSSIPLSQRTFTQGILISSSGIASIFGPLFISPAVQNLGYKETYLILTAIAVIVSLVLLFVIPNNVTTATTVQKVTEKISLKTILSNRLVWILFVCDLLINAVMYGVVNWTPSFLTSDEVGFSLTQQGKMTSITGACFLIGSLGGSFIVGKYFLNKERLVIAVTTLAGSATLFLAYQMPHGNAINMIPITLCFAFAEFCYATAFVSLVSLPLKRFKPTEFSPSYAFMATGGILGGAIAPYLIGALVEKTGSYATVFTLFLILGLLSAIVIFFVPKHYTPIDSDVSELDELSQQEL
ncbi:MFS transporter [Bacilli bacterium]|nr:MFS transporter [Bacilli bacterium]